jgi:hypothetical protein
VFFGLGQGKDYIYAYKGEFIGLHKNDILETTSLQKKNYTVDKLADILPKYYILKINNFNNIARAKP